jgi:hypothetical protein
MILYAASYLKKKACVNEYFPQRKRHPSKMEWEFDFTIYRMVAHFMFIITFAKP